MSPNRTNINQKKLLSRVKKTKKKQHIKNKLRTERVFEMQPCSKYLCWETK